MSRPGRTRALAALAAWSWVAGCVPSLEQNPPREANDAVPARYAEAPGSGGTSKAGAANLGQTKWQAFFTDPKLEALIELALKNNQELNIVQQEILVAKAETLASEGEYLPRLGFGAGAGVDKVGEHTSQGVSDEAHGVPRHLQSYRFGFAASWEVDVWKKLRNAAKAAALRYLASVEGRNYLATRLVAEIANSYYELLALDRQLAVLRSNIELQEAGLGMMRLQKEAARVTQLAVRRFEAEVVKNQSRQFALQQQIIETENRINFLVGRFPQPVARDVRGLDEPLPELVSAGLPSQLLDNRPDVREAALRLQAAKLDVAVARARFLPSLSIDAAVGYEAFNAKHLVATPGSLAYNVGANLSAPLLNRQAIKAQYFAANAQQLQAVFNYERALLRAFTEVVNQLATIDNLHKQYQKESQQVDMLTESVEVSNVLFQSARAEYTEVLLTRREALESQMELIETRLHQRRAAVNVYQALGGGWR